MRLYVFVFVTIPYSYGQLRETEYECGRHGRFEYCIDGIPGCVIGCHCHPGYYFDTDTKICEPNIRLTQNFRRQNYEVAEPTRVFVAPTPPLLPVVEQPSTAAPNAVDEKIDIITKDADDLGDWLYNQFFKTIENQVINETKDDSVITRRSGHSDHSPTIVKTPTRRSHKYWRAKRRRKKKRKGLKSKLLRITEDDSLFDSSSNSASDESSDSSASSSASESRDTSSKEHKPGNGGSKNDHGHKKIVVFNKRPKPPLPSFIFLPNMETPFFPPIGLPPPPMPMYPMVPVPPMMPFPFPPPTPPCQGNNNDNGSKPTASPTTEAASPAASEVARPAPDANGNTGDAEAENATPVEDDANTPVKTPDEPETINENAEQNGENNETGAGNSLRTRMKKRRGPRNKLVQKLRDKLKRKNKLQNYFANAYQETDSPIPNSLPEFIPSHLPNRHKTLPEINVEEELAGLQDVDFKYLSQLIHRADLNRTSQSSSEPPTTITLPTIPIKNALTEPPPSRRNYDSNPEQITQVLSNLANQGPLNPNPENQAAISHYSPNQPKYNSPYQPYDMPNKPPFNVPNKSLYNAPNKSPYGAPNQETYNALNQLTYNGPNPHIYKAPNQPTYNNLAKPSTYNAPNQLTYNTPNQLTYSVPNQLTYNAPNQPNYNTANQLKNSPPNNPTYVSLNQPARNVPHRKKIEDTNDLYYSNLGRQIASMIRNIDGDKEVDIEIKASSSVQNNPLLSSNSIPNNPLITGNSGSRSYWERSVRSPYNYVMNSYKEQINELKKSNEDLFSIENKVEMAALNNPTLSLHELENIISKMQRAKSQFIEKHAKPHGDKESSKTSFNVNLLPENNHHWHSHERSKIKARNNPHKRSRPSMANNSTNTQNLTHNPTLITKRQHEQPALFQDEAGRSLLTDFMFTLQDPEEFAIETIPDATRAHTIIPNLVPTRKPFPMASPKRRYKKPNPYLKSYGYTVLPLPVNPSVLNNLRGPYVQATTSRTYYQPLSQMMLNHKRLNYYDGKNNNQYLYEKTSVPVQHRPFPSRTARVGQYDTYGTRVVPSYFHHEVRHFDYFDDLT